MAESVREDRIKRAERELAKEDSLLSNMIEQAPGMIGMAAMFVVTIMLAIWLQPWFNAAGLQAFGESGSTQVRWVALELLAIFAFTFLILWMAKKHLEKFIKYGMLAVLFLALCYTTVPGAHILLVPEIETEYFEFTETDAFGVETTGVTSDGSVLTQKSFWANESMNDTFEIMKMSNDFQENVWPNPTVLDAFPGEPHFNVVEGIYSYTITNGAWVWSIDKDSGEVLSRYACFDDSEYNGSWATVQPHDQIDSACAFALEVIEYEEPSDISNNPAKGAIYVINLGGEFVRLTTFYGTNQTTFQAKWAIPSINIAESSILIKQYDEDSMFISSEEGGAMLTLEKQADGYDGGGVSPPQWADPLEMDWSYRLADDENRGENDTISAVNIVPSPWDVESELVILGFVDGSIDTYIIDDDGDGNYSAEDRFHSEGAFSGPITAIESFDLTGNGENELWIGDADGVHGLFYESLIEYATLDVELEPQTRLFLNNYTISGIDTVTTTADHRGQVIEVSTTELNFGEFDPDNMYNSYGIQWSGTAILIGLGLAIILMVGLMLKPEWYVVNTVGILVGAGVIVMLGVTFVPTLIVIFMVLAAIYDAWAVYKSKHMLDLADTMIGLNLPILLVAPQESGYSMIDDDDSPRQTIKPSEAKDLPKDVKVVKKKSKEAMFMGLGDVIFPGMLVVSCVDSIAVDGLLVGISALIGGLVGYLVLMTYVASGRPQAGLPLLNGGAILGYIIGGALFVGSAAFSFGITF